MAALTRPALVALAASLGAAGPRAGFFARTRIWHLVAYVRALSANVPADVRPSRMDAMAVKPPESLRSPEPPSPPAAGERR